MLVWGSYSYRAALPTELNSTHSLPQTAELTQLNSLNLTNTRQPKKGLI